jgi:hypothetical protein
MARCNLEGMVQRSTEAKSIREVETRKMRTRKRGPKWQRYAPWNTMLEQGADTLIACTCSAAVEGGGYRGHIN